MKVSTIYKGFNILIGLMVLYYTLSFVQIWDVDFLLNSSDEINPFYLILAFFAYIAAHFFRSVRLFVIIGVKIPRFSDVIVVQLMTNGVNLLLPFKIGEIYRITEFSRIFKKSSVVLYSIILERFLDLILLLIILFSLLFVGTNLKGSNEFSSLFYISLVLLIFSLMIIFVLPDNIKELRLIIAKHSSSNRGIWWLLKLKEIDVLINQNFIGFKTNSSTILSLTMIIWVLEISTFLVFAIILDNFSAIVLLAVLVFLSSLLPTGPLGYGGVQLAFYYTGLIYSSPNLVNYASVYQIFIFGPAIILSIIFYIYKLKTKTNDV